MKQFITNSKQETIEVAKGIAPFLTAKDVIFFKGGLGMGKTAFCQGICDGLLIDATVTSPTFAIVNEYIKKPLSFYHFDMYRIEDEDQLYNIGFYDYLDYNGVVAIEWAENIQSFFAENTIEVKFEKISENSRKITIKAEFFDDEI